jgi:CBS domain-containing protein
MTPNDVVVSPETTLAEAARELARVEISGLPVTDSNGRVVGIVTESDLLGTSPNNTVVQALMTPHIVTVDEFTPADHVVQLLREHKIHHLPVIRQGVVVGWITPQSVIQYFVTHELPSPPEAA